MSFLLRQFKGLPVIWQQIRHKSVASSFKFSDLDVQLCSPSELREKPNPDNLVFGANFSDHMLEIDWTEEQGWGKPRICPLHNFSIHPAAKVFHYAVELYEGLKAYRGADGKVRIFRPDLNMERCNITATRATLPLFEGMKAYRGDDQRIRLFRPEANIQRMTNSAKRSCLPILHGIALDCGPGSTQEYQGGICTTLPRLFPSSVSPKVSFDGDELTKCLKKLISVDKEWVPYSTTSTLYVRPTMIGTEPSLGVTMSKEAKLFVITGPVGPYYPTGFKPVSLLADPQYVRAWEGGCGSFKMGANYAPTIYIQIEALKKHDCQQVLWLYGSDHQCTEVGTMNIFMMWKNEKGEKELITPPLSTGVILPGVTRKSLLELAKSWGEFKVTEKVFTMKDISKALDESRILEIFGAGTACVVCPVEKIVYQGRDLHIPTMDNGAQVTMRMYKELTDIQFGRTKSDWVVEVD